MGVTHELHLCCKFILLSAKGELHATVHGIIAKAPEYYWIRLKTSDVCLFLSLDMRMRRKT